MKKTTILSALTVCALMIASAVQATVWRVNNTAGSSAHYTSIQAAHDAATTVNGDTLYVEASSASVGALSTSKRLTIIGTGYFLGENPQTQASPLASYVDYIYFQVGSQGSKVMGLSIGYIYLYTSDIFINRCYIYTSSYPIYAVSNGVSNIIISQNYLYSYYYWNPAVYFPYSASNILVSNNFIYGSISTIANFSGIITNNVIYGELGAHNAVYKNNIHRFGGFTPNNSVYTHNISYSTTFGTANNNQANVDMNSVFLGATGNSTDGQWRLSATSPAIGAGENGVDCGMFGGPFPYVLSGMPNIPSIYYLNAPAVPSNTIDVAIKAKSHN